ncbi:hypothetical protein [Natronosalvus caseinilyticus]|uniref:hypothetical protein n=1 Tax=Natronosalvus caseinilyticus TaxID=2953747 RepID=UPI0028B12180|nr:hypothetical protein [Natronosalvus caseinilyticus]
MSKEEVVVLHFDEEKTDVPAYNELAKHIADEFRQYDFEMGPTRKVYALDVATDIPEPAVEWAYFAIKEVGSFAIYEYLRRNFGESEENEESSDTEQNVIIQTNSGNVVIKEMEMMSAREAKEVTGHFELLSEGGGLKRHYGDDEEIMEKYGSERQEEDEEDEIIEESESQEK